MQPGISPQLQRGNSSQQQGMAPSVPQSASATGVAQVGTPVVRPASNPISPAQQQQHPLSAASAALAAASAAAANRANNSSTPLSNAGGTPTAGNQQQQQRGLKRKSVNSSPATANSAAPQQPLTKSPRVMSPSMAAKLHNRQSGVGGSVPQTPLQGSGAVNLPLGPADGSATANSVPPTSSAPITGVSVDSADENSKKTADQSASSDDPQSSSQSATAAAAATTATTTSATAAATSQPDTLDITSAAVSAAVSGPVDASASGIAAQALLADLKSPSMQAKSMASQTPTASGAAVATPQMQQQFQQMLMSPGSSSGGLTAAMIANLNMTPAQRQQLLLQQQQNQAQAQGQQPQTPGGPSMLAQGAVANQMTAAQQQLLQQQQQLQLQMMLTSMVPNFAQLPPQLQYNMMTTLSQQRNVQSLYQHLTMALQAPNIAAQQRAQFTSQLQYVQTQLVALNQQQAQQINYAKTLAAMPQQQQQQLQAAQQLQQLQQQQQQQQILLSPGQTMQGLDTGAAVSAEMMATSAAAAAAAASSGAMAASAAVASSSISMGASLAGGDALAAQVSGQPSSGQAAIGTSSALAANGADFFQQDGSSGNVSEPTPLQAAQQGTSLQKKTSVTSAAASPSLAAGARLGGGLSHGGSSTEQKPALPLATATTSATIHNQHTLAPSSAASAQSPSAQLSEQQQQAPAQPAIVLSTNAQQATPVTPALASAPAGGKVNGTGTGSGSTRPAAAPLQQQSANFYMGPPAPPTVIPADKITELLDDEQNAQLAKWQAEVDRISRSNAFKVRETTQYQQREEMYRRILDEQRQSNAEMVMHMRGEREMEKQQLSQRFPWGAGYDGYGNGRTLPPVVSQNGRPAGVPLRPNLQEALMAGGSMVPQSVAMRWLAPVDLIMPGFRPSTSASRRVLPTLRFSKRQLRRQAAKRETLVPIRLDLDSEGLRLRDTFTWDLGNELITPLRFAQHLCVDLEMPTETFVPAIVQAIEEQLEDFRQVLQVQGQKPEAVHQTLLAEYKAALAKKAGVDDADKIDSSRDNNAGVVGDGNDEIVASSIPDVGEAKGESKDQAEVIGDSKTGSEIEIKGEEGAAMDVVVADSDSVVIVKDEIQGSSQVTETKDGSADAWPNFESEDVDADAEAGTETGTKAEHEADADSVPVIGPTNATVAVTDTDTDNTTIQADSVVSAEYTVSPPVPAVLNTSTSSDLHSSAKPDNGTQAAEILPKGAAAANDSLAIKAEAAAELLVATSDNNMLSAVDSNPSDLLSLDSKPRRSPSPPTTTSVAGETSTQATEVIPMDVDHGAATEPPAKVLEPSESALVDDELVWVDDELRVVIRIDIIIGHIALRDQLEWDIAPLLRPLAADDSLRNALLAFSDQTQTDDEHDEDASQQVPAADATSVVAGGDAGDNAVPLSPGSSQQDEHAMQPSSASAAVPLPTLSPSLSSSSSSSSSAPDGADESELPSSLLRSWVHGALEGQAVTPEHVAHVLCAERRLGGEFETAIAHAIREQLHAFVKCFLLAGYTYRPHLVPKKLVHALAHQLPRSVGIDDRELARSILPPVSRVLREAPAITALQPCIAHLHSADVDRLEKDMEREARRKRRQVRGRGRQGLVPDREVHRTNRTMIALPSWFADELPPGTRSFVDVPGEGAHFLDGLDARATHEIAMMAVANGAQAVSASLSGVPGGASGSAASQLLENLSSSNGSIAGYDSLLGGAEDLSGVRRAAAISSMSSSAASGGYSGSSQLLSRRYASGSGKGLAPGLDMSLAGVGGMGGGGSAGMMGSGSGGHMMGGGGSGSALASGSPTIVPATPATPLQAARERLRNPTGRPRGRPSILEKSLREASSLRVTYGKGPHRPGAAPSQLTGRALEELVARWRCMCCGLTPDRTPLIRRGPESMHSLCDECGQVFAETNGRFREVDMDEINANLAHTCGPLPEGGAESGTVSGGAGSVLKSVAEVAESSLSSTNNAASGAAASGGDSGAALDMAVDSSAAMDEDEDGDDVDDDDDGGGEMS
ncbi:SWI/SNF chromatin-remodeling complex subunit [Coemansia sp. Benny D115]|nr:SWI/SNF chromatin-remodeling complex subunit [Coemansia sp. Benny D115]